MTRKPYQVVYDNRKRYTGKTMSLFQWWHVSFFWSVIGNIITRAVVLYTRQYYWPYKCRFSALRFPISFGTAIGFHLLRRLAFFVMVVLLYLFYSGKVSNGYVLFVLYSLFLMFFLDRLLCQAAEISVFLYSGSESLISLLLCCENWRKPLITTHEYIHKNVRPEDLFPRILMGVKYPKIKTQVRELVHDIREAKATFIKREMFRFILLPLRHVFFLILLYGMLVLCLEIHWQNRGKMYAFNNLGHAAPDERSVSTFCEDFISSLYFQAITVTTIGYGDITPNKQSVMLRFLMVVLLLGIVFTLFLSLNLSLKAHEQFIGMLGDKKTLRRELLEFFINPTPYLLVH